METTENKRKTSEYIIGDNTTWDMREISDIIEAAWLVRLRKGTVTKA